MKYEVVIFDLDGTLTDSKLGITKSIQYALKKYGLDIENLDELIKFIGPPLMESFSKYYLFSEKKSREALEYYREYYTKKGMFENAVYHGIETLLKQLKIQGEILCVATVKPTKFTEIILKHFKLIKYFDIVIGSEFDGSRSSKTELIKEVIEQSKVNSLSKFIMVGDREQDIIGARENGISVAAVTYGYGAKEELENLKPDYLAQSILELSNILLD